MAMQARPLLLAHRGAHSASIAENSIAAFDRALDLGCDGFECDVRLTACGRALVCHDAKVDGVTVARATPTQLMRLPCVEEVIYRYGGRGFLDIELKVRGLETQLLAALREHPPQRDYLVSSFLPDVVLELKARSGVVPLGIICAKSSELMAWRKLPVEYVVVHKALITRRLVRLIHAAGKRIFAWTVNDEKSMLQLSGWGVDAIISDKAQVLMKVLPASGILEDDQPNFGLS
jgi:glycerophosphoryl diester phosphodiesterase